MEISDILIWGGLAVIIVRYVLPRVLEMFGMKVEKRPNNTADQ